MKEKSEIKDSNGLTAEDWGQHNKMPVTAAQEQFINRGLRFVVRLAEDTSCPEGLLWLVFGLSEIVNKLDGIEAELMRGGD